MKREEKLVKNTLILALGTFFPKLAIFIALPVLTGCLTQAEYGTYELVLTLVALVLPAATLQIHSAAFRYLIDVRGGEKEKKTIISNIYGFIVPTTLIALTIMFFCLYMQPLAIRLSICAYFFFDILVQANRQIIRGLGRNKDYAVSSFISALGQVVLTFMLVLGLKKGLLGAVIALFSAECIAAVHLMIAGRIYRYIDPREINRATMKELIGYSWPMVPNSLSQWVIHTSDRLIITFFMGVSANAVFSVAYKIPSILTFAQTTFNMAWQENASIVSKDDDAQAYYSMMFEKLFDIAAGCMAALIGFTPILFSLFIQGNYEASYIHIPFLYIGMFLFTLSTFWGGIFVAYKKTTVVGKTTVIAALIHLVIAVLLIKPLGLFAASIATVVSYFALCFLRLYYVREYITIQYKWKHIGFVCLILLALSGMCVYRNLAMQIAVFCIGGAVCLFLNWSLIKAVVRKVKKIIG
ncbi:MAG: oligosaccharide flippase family protein [Clostridia bacterium]|nr:oligosaccharide flippase family protein [Clostridia bacterium]